MNLNELHLALASRSRNRLGFARTAGVSVPFLNYVLCPINFDEYEVSDTEALQAVGAFLELSNADRLRLSFHVHAHYLASARAMGSEYDDEHDMLGGKAPPASQEDVWRLVTGSDLMVRKENDVLYVLVVSDCEWELDDGFCMIFRHGKELVKVGDLNCGPLEPEQPGDRPDLTKLETAGGGHIISYERM
ncbi:MAG: hypothetical protein GY948_01770 [Alphaproteobacteria bacterium]|nr:hypothetical protein [Alphaproteobacteria bacterium]